MAHLAKGEFACCFKPSSRSAAPGVTHVTNNETLMDSSTCNQNGGLRGNGPEDAQRFVLTWSSFRRFNRLPGCVDREGRAFQYPDAIWLPHVAVRRGPTNGEGRLGTMNALIWIGQIALATVFFVAGGSKIFAYRRMVQTLESLPRRARIEMTHAQAVLIGVLEIAGAIWSDDAGGAHARKPRPGLSAGPACGQCSRASYGGRHLVPFPPQRARRAFRDNFSLALFVIVGRWPH